MFDEFFIVTNNLKILSLILSMSKDNLLIRKAIRDDAQHIGNVLLDFYNMSDHSEATNAFISELKKEFHYIVAIEDGQILGLITWLMHGLPKHGLFELDRICILSKARGKGIGKKLVSALISDAQEWYKSMNEQARKLYLLTHEDNTNAHVFYERVGFLHETTLKDHYYKNQDERVYAMFFL